MRNEHLFEFVTLELDMSKAYCSMEWCFLLQLVDKMGFHSKWIGLISTCISFESSNSMKTLMLIQTPILKLRLDYFYSNLPKCGIRVNKLNKSAKPYSTTMNNKRKV